MLEMCFVNHINDYLIYDFALGTKALVIYIVGEIINRRINHIYMPKSTILGHFLDPTNARTAG